MKINIVGCGLSGAVAAIKFKERGHKVEIFETRQHIGGNCYDSVIEGITVHKYGPHSFHTNNERVWNFLNKYTKFNDVSLRVIANTTLGQIPIPFNDTSARIVGEKTPEEIRDLIFVPYSQKQWGVPWSCLSEEIRCRVPVRRKGQDLRYHTDTYQGIPEDGYTRMFQSMLEGIKVHLKCRKDDWKRYKCNTVFYTGGIDEYYDYCFGKLGYRSLDIEYNNEPKRRIMQLNECNAKNAWTRTIDHSHWYRQDVKQTIISKEFACDYDGDNIAYYPKPFGGNVEIYRKYKNLADKEKNTIFLGRLATYRYLDMDDAIEEVLLRLENL